MNKEKNSFSAYDFMVLFSALNVKNTNYYFNKDDLLGFIMLAKEQGEYSHLLDNININNDETFYYSKELNDAISSLVWSQSIYFILNEDKLSAYINRDIAVDEILKKREDYITYMEEFIDNYNNYLEKTKNVSFKKLGKKIHAK